MSLIKENISEYVDGINSLPDIKGGQILYQRTGRGINLKDGAAVDKHINNIRKSGLSREFGGDNGEAYGEGLYTSLRLSDCVNNSSGYGDIILKLWVPGFERCLIDMGCRYYGQDLAVIVHGHDAPMYKQVQKLFNPNDAAKFSKVTDIRPFIPKAAQGVLQENDIDGIIYQWFRTHDNLGHWVCVWKDYKRIFPLAYSVDYGRTFHTLGNEDTLSVSLKSWEPQRVLGKDFTHYTAIDGDAPANLRAEEGGYFLVKDKRNGLCNYINCQTRKPVSKVWFDLASAIKNGCSTVDMNGRSFLYDVNDNMLYDDDWAWECNEPLGTPEEVKMKMNESTKLVFGNLLNEVLNEYIPGANRDTIHDRNQNGLITFYRLSLPNQVQSIATNGFTKEFRGTGNDNTDWLGSGTYGCLDPHWRTGNYGSILWAYGTPAQLVRDTYISPDPHLARRYGIQGSFEEQLERFFPDLAPKWKEKGIWGRIITPGHSGSGTIKKLNAIAFHGDGGRSDHFYHSHGVNGIIYHGSIDGDAVLTFDDSTIIPLAWRDNSKRGSEWHQIEICDTLWDRTFNGYDPLAFLKGTYKDYAVNPNDIMANYRVINGYMKVCNKTNGKYNYIKAPEGGRNFTSPIWFDFASDVDRNGIASVEINNEQYIYTPQDGNLYHDMDALDWEEPSGNVHNF